MDSSTLTSSFGHLSFNSNISHRDDHIKSPLNQETNLSIVLTNPSFLNDTLMPSNLDDTSDHATSQTLLAPFWRSNTSNYTTSGNYNNNNKGLYYSSTNLAMLGNHDTHGSGGMSSQNSLFQMTQNRSVASTQENQAATAPTIRNTKGMNINAPSYVPSYSNQSQSGPSYGASNSQSRNDYDSSPFGNKYYYNPFKPSEYSYVANNDTQDGDSTAMSVYSSNTGVNTANNTTATSNRTNTTGSLESIQEDYKQLKVELILKNQIVKNLTEQLQLMNKNRTKFMSETLNNNNNNSNTSETKFKVPRNHYQVFQDLSRTLQDKTSELEDTKTRLEALVIGLTITKGNTRQFIAQGEYDEMEISHKIINKLNLLTEENENLLKMLSFSNKSSLLIELGLVRHENKLLKEKLEKYESQAE